MERKEIGNLTDLSILSIEYNRENSHWEKEGIRNLADDLTIFRLKIYRSTLSNRDNRERHVPPFLASQNFPPSGTNTTDSIHTERRRCLIQISIYRRVLLLEQRSLAFHFPENCHRFRAIVPSFGSGVDRRWWR